MEPGHEHMLHAEASIKGLERTFQEDMPPGLLQKTQELVRGGGGGGLTGKSLALVMLIRLQ